MELADRFVLTFEGSESEGVVRARRPRGRKTVGRLAWSQTDDGTFSVDSVIIDAHCRRKGLGTRMYREWMNRHRIVLSELAPTSKTRAGRRFRTAIDAILPGGTEANR